MTGYRRLGQVSVPVPGGAPFGSPKWHNFFVEEHKGFEILKAAWDLGVTTIDNANNYSNDESERIFSKFLKKYIIPSHRVTNLTKCYHVVDEGVDSKGFADPGLKDTRDYVKQSGLSRAAIFNQVGASLERLQTAYIDPLQVHRFVPNTPIEETMKALHDLVQGGKVRCIGGRSMRTWQLAKMNEIAFKIDGLHSSACRASAHFSTTRRCAVIVIAAVSLLC